MLLLSSSLINATNIKQIPRYNYNIALDVSDYQGMVYVLDVYIQFDVILRAVLWRISSKTSCTALCNIILMFLVISDPLTMCS